MDIDLALILGAIGTIGTVISTILVVLQIKDQMRAKTEEREKKVANLLEEIFGPIRLADDNFGTSDALTPMTKHLLVNRNKIIGLSPSLWKLVPTIAEPLEELFELMEHGDGDAPVSAAIFLNSHSDTSQPLIGKLRDEVQKWLDSHV